MSVRDTLEKIEDEVKKARGDHEYTALEMALPDLAYEIRLLRRLARRLAHDILSIAETAGIPDIYKQTDSRMRRARKALKDVR